MAHKVKTQSLPATPAPPTQKMTYEEFLAWADEDTWAEWVDGEVILLSPVSNKHQDLAGFLAALLRLFAEAHQAGTVIIAPFQMKTAADLPGREPDIIFIAREHIDRLQDVYMDGPADLVVEIISPDSRTRDRRRKFGEYQRGGVREYWLLDPLRKRAEFHHRGDDGLYRQIPIGDDGILHSAVLEGLWLRVAWLWQKPLPLLMDVLREWGLI